eukprot:TRINITY_DN31790_c0_g1_i2.p1 TRINITY_DN31790_c0_g1~~TRINITY_DN31790_c0_g1_i2.p1  ORF type:complete len:654 (+),score=94.33 TRINITY_DN31790_c0_g1_i2:192-1964(+)
MVLARFPEPFEFGLATAPAHVEKTYEGDPWQKWATKGNVAAYSNAPFRDERLRFLQEPEVDLDLAAKTGIQVFRMGVEWGRLAPQHPAATGQHIQNREALEKYREICLMVKARKMKVMMTLFHHSMPIWASADGGWTNESTAEYFLDFAKEAASALSDVVDYWVTFNEPHVFVLLSNCVGVWPPGLSQPPSTTRQLRCVFGDFLAGMDRIAKSHTDFYTWAHSGGLPNPSIGVAHNVAHNVADNYFLDGLSVATTENLMKFKFIDSIKSSADWIGLNYYGKEIISKGGVKIDDDVEYSESGRAISADGFFRVLMQFHEKYANDPKAKFKSYKITENGISDGDDILRPSYIVEHLLALREAQRAGMNISGYIHWTVSDNWEWADGYCPKFGLVDVLRHKNLTRVPRGSYHLWTDIVGNRTISLGTRNRAWRNVAQAALTKQPRRFCRASDGVTGLDDAVERSVSLDDWRFTRLSQAEDGICYHTPWKGFKVVVEEAEDGQPQCLISPDGDATYCKRALKIQRELRCPGLIETSTAGALCQATPRYQPSCMRFPTKWKPCCCQNGACGHGNRGYFAATCPPGFQKSEDEQCS